ncbi:ralBP1-associated Eps domain-containing protein 2 isoform X4 [Lissotriton helveticus]
MEPAAPALGLLPLSEAEQKCYSELFVRCQAEGAGRGTAAGGSKVGELFRATQLPADTLHQITDLCGAKRVGYFGPAQFYVALKLIAAAQAGFPVRLESIKNDLPLPRFLAVKTDSELRCGIPSLGPEAHILKSGQALHAAQENSFKHVDDGDTQQETDSPPLSPVSSSPPSPSSYLRTHLPYGYAAYDTRQPVQSVPQQEGPVTATHGPKPANSHSILNRSFSVEREVQDSSNNYFEDPWRITEEQREYYINQFKSLQPDLHAFISGSVAKNFFTKSKLPIPELSHIWELSDVDRDGALNLLEFCAAFHLIVARKNGYTLPETLPQTLLPAVSPSPSLDCTLYDSYREPTPINQQTRDFNRTELETVSEDPVNAEPLILFDVETPTAEPKTSNEGTPVKSALKTDLNNEDQQVVKKCTTPKIITKDFKAIQSLSVKTAGQQESYTLKARPRSRSYSSTSIEDTVKKVEEPPTPPPRPQKTHSRASSLDLNKIFQQSSPANRAGWLPPPALPPRPSVSQTPHHVPTTEQSVQLKPSLQQANYADFNIQEQIDQGSEVELPPPPLKRIPSQTEESSPSKKEVQLAQPPSKPMRRKFRQESQSLENKEQSPTVSLTSSHSLKAHPSVQKQPSKQKRVIQTAIRKNKEANAVLARLNSELQQQLKEVHQERITLETQLEQLRPVTVL